MKWRRGFFRLWIVASTVFALGVLVYGWSEYSNADSSWRRFAFVPSRCTEVTGEIGVDFGLTRIGPGDWDKRTYFDANRLEPCWQPLSKFRDQHPEMVRISDVYLMRQRYQKFAPGEYLYEGPDFWSYMGIAAGFAVAVPLFFLLVGGIIGWIIMGFRREA